RTGVPTPFLSVLRENFPRFTTVYISALLAGHNALIFAVGKSYTGSMFCPAGSTMREDTAMIDISEGSKIAEFYKGQTLFITGASGFMGKVLLEKILYACPGIVRIYILVRPKRGKSPKTRLEEMAKLPLFHRVHKERPHAFEKVVLVNGDVTMDDLGLSSEDRTLLEKEVTVVFHGAATLRLEAILKDAVEMNLNGTWRILQLCKKMSRLKVGTTFNFHICFRMSRVNGTNSSCLILNLSD
ncbi:unnamed protein product, partial [Timema podura]|nr:unnamed protein product [Timema podura]